MYDHDTHTGEASCFDLASKLCTITKKRIQEKIPNTMTV